MGAMPIKVKENPSNALKSPFTKDFPLMVETKVRLNIPMEKYSYDAKLRAMLASQGETKKRTIRLNMPPRNEKTILIPRALPALPC